MTDNVMRTLAYLSRVVEPSFPQLSALVARVGPVEAADRVRRRAIDDQLMRLTEARHEIDCAAEDLAVLLPQLMEIVLLGVVHVPGEAARVVPHAMMALASGAEPRILLTGPGTVQLFTYGLRTVTPL